MGWKKGSGLKKAGNLGGGPTPLQQPPTLQEHLIQLTSIVQSSPSSSKQGHFFDAKP